MEIHGFTELAQWKDVRLRWCGTRAGSFDDWAVLPVLINMHHYGNDAASKTLVVPYRSLLSVEIL